MATCCPSDLPGVLDVSYEPKGVTKEMGGVSVYFAGTPGAKGIIHVYDIFGPSSQSKQVADTLSKAGFYVAIPDFFNGNPWALSNFPPPKPEEFKAWVGSFGFEEKIKPVVEAVQAAMRSEGVQSFGCVGFCWGGKMMMEVVNSGLAKAGATCHPAMIDRQQVEKATVPLCFLSSKDDGDLMDVVRPVLEKRDTTFIKHFPDMFHGWVQGRADFGNEDNAKQAAEAVQLVADFFTKHV